VKDLTRKFDPQMILIESGGDNLAANFSRELADYIIYVIDVAGSVYSQFKAHSSKFLLINNLLLL